MSFVRGVVALAAAAIALAGCGGAIASPSPTYTAVPIGPTAWPSGTTGQYGLRIDPSLLGKLPGHAGALPITEDAGSEAAVLDDADAAKTIDRYVAASAGGLGDPDWLNIAVVHFKPDSQNGDVYSAWVDQYAKGACSQAGGVSGTDQQDIGDFRPDISTCAGGITVYTFQRGDWVVVSMYELGPKHIGRALIAATY
jgi:ABC-type glycerol-3-phosphate transport system substrate-binding protein